MDNSFSSGVSSTPPNPIFLSSSTELISNRELLRVLLIGSRKGVNNTIQTLYSLGFAPVGEWSPLLPAPNPSEVMSILTRYLDLN